MRKLGLFAVAAGLALSGSVARADFTITSARVPGATTDTVTFFIQSTNSGSNAGFPLLNTVTTSLYDATTGAGHGLFVATNTQGKVNAYTGSQSHFVQMTGFSPIDGGPATLTTVQGSPHVLNLNGTTNTLGTGYAASSTIQVSGLGGAVGIIGDGIDVSAAPAAFAVAVVPTGDVVQILQTTSSGDAPGNRTIFTDFEPAGTEFTATNSSASANKIVLATNASTTPFSDGTAVPEPASLGLIGLAMGGLLARRRRSA